MSKKLLSEAQGRRFQSLARIVPLNEMGYYEADEDPADMEPAPEEMDMPDVGGMDDEMDMSDEMEDEEVLQLSADKLEKAEQALADLQDLMADLAGASEDMDDDEEMEDEEPAELAPAEDPEPEEMEEMYHDKDDKKMEEEEEVMEEDIIAEALEGVSYVPSKKEIISEVARRVAKRISQAKKAQKDLDRALGNK